MQRANIKLLLVTKKMVDPPVLHKSTVEWQKVSQHFELTSQNES